MLDELDSVVWTQYPQPEWNSASTVPDAIRALAMATDASALDAYHRFLYSVGNNHAGTYYPVVLLTIPFLGSILEITHGATRARVLDVLIDLTGSFQPERGYETTLTRSGREDVAILLSAAVLKLLPLIQSIAVSVSSSPEERSLAIDLIECLNGKDEG